MIKFKTSGWSTKIEPVECARETDSFVWVGSRRQAKVSDYARFFDSWEAAHAHLIERAERDLNEARKALQRAQGEFGNVKGMKKPEGL